MRGASLLVLGSALAAGLLAVACGSSNGSSPSGNDAGEMADTSSSGDTGGGGDTGSATDTGPGKDSGAADAGEAEAAGYPAFVPDDVPQVVNGGGPVMTAPKLQPIFFAADDAMTVASVKDFVSKLPGSTYWKTWSSEYGVGDISILPAITLSETLPSPWADALIQQDLANRLSAGDAGTDAGDPPLPAADANTIYAFFLPPGVDISLGGGPPTDAGGGGGTPTCLTSAYGVGGYHSDLQLSDGTPVSYAVIPRCMAGFANLSGLDALTGPASHEIAEAASDPFPDISPAYYTVDTPHGYWSRLIGGGELGDMCEDFNSFAKFDPEIPYVVQRIWSNKAAKAGGDPCVPLPTGDVYFNSYPVMPDMITYSSRGGMVTSKGVEIPVGSSKTIELDLASNGPTSGPWTVSIADSSSTGNTYLSATFQECPGKSTCTGKNGDKLHMTIKVLAAGRRGTEPFIIQSVLSANAYSLWIGLVGSGTPTDAGGGG